MYCKLRRAHYTTQAIPLDAAPEEFATLDDNLLTTWCQITNISFVMCSKLTLPPCVDYVYHGGTEVREYRQSPT
jgi:hypothetical protein